ncbi:hypothetical protein CSC74_09465 [Pseudoxanthomonas yeongjuensis]|uniref:hypothetical protein n=1 Tax=Pseudoxanthomonas yeongjuensis TaxID=377616 RepID=UPI001390B5FF|nr:hypothetical protein [Pseudoxanthomonas yeongjuensis]KAF1717074.1 hypothetical protein CSC74_09465 [Pseudoxanthomonas yeongjuensis]
MNPSSGTKRRLLRWTGWALLALVVLYALYLLAGNLFLNTSLGQAALNRQPEKFQMRWARGSTWWPGRVSLSGVELEGHARHTRWSIRAAGVRGRIGLLPLLRREVHVPHVWVVDATAAVDQVDAEQPAPVPRPGGWTLRFDRIASDTIQRGSFGKLLLEGKGSAEFGFVKQLRGGPMEVLPSTVKFSGAHLTQEGREYLRDGRLDARFAIARHTRAQAQGLDKLRLSDIELELQGTTAALAVALDAKGQGTFKTVPGQGQAKAGLKFSRGVLAPGSRLRWQMPLISTDPKGVTHTDHVQVALQVDRDMALTVYMPPQADGAFGLDADLRIAGNQVPLKDFGSVLPRTSGHVAGQWRFSSLRWLGRFFTKAPWLTLDGAGDVTADVQVANGKVAAGSKFSVPEVAVVAEVMSNRIEGRGRADGRFDAGANGGLLPTLNIVLSHFNVAANDNLHAPYVQGNDLHLDVAAGEDLAALRDSLRAHLTFRGARIPDLRIYNRYLPSQHLRFEGGSGVLSGDLHLDAQGDIGRGWIRVNGRKARMRVAGMTLRGDIDINTRLRRADLANRNFAVDGSSIALDNISFSEPGGETRGGWWARIDLPRARMDWDKPLDIGGTASVRMKDVGFLLSLFSRQKEYPKWVFKLIDAGQAQVQGRVQWQRDTLVLDRITANNDRFDLQARLRLRGQRRDGSLYAKWGVLSMAVQAEGPKNRFHLLRARQWYDAQPELRP